MVKTVQQEQDFQQSDTQYIVYIPVQREAFRQRNLRQIQFAKTRIATVVNLGSK